MRKLENAEQVLHRMVLVRRGIKKFDIEPIVHDNQWLGVITAVTPRTENEKTVDYVLQIKLQCGTSRLDESIEVPYLSDAWRLRFPWKSEQ